MDDIKDDNLTHLEEIADKPRPGDKKPPHEVGPESEVRGGAEAPTEE